MMEEGGDGPKLFRIAVSGSRGITDAAFVAKVLDGVVIPRVCDGMEVELHLGDAAGVDQLALEWARERGIGRLIYFASRPHYEKWLQEGGAQQFEVEGGTLVSDWTVDGLKAGHLRNHAMIKGCNLLVAVWDGASRGTNGAIRSALSQLVKSETHFYPSGSIGISENTRQSVTPELQQRAEKGGS